MPPFALAALRFFFAAVPLVFFIRRPQMPWRYVVAYGFAIGVCQFGLLFLGMKLGMPAGLSSLVIQVQVFFTIGLGIVFLGDRLQRAEPGRRGHRAAGIVLLGRVQDGAAARRRRSSASCWCWSPRWRGRSATSSPSARAGDHEPDMFALVVWSSLVPPLPLAVLSYLFEGGSRGVGRGRPRRAGSRGACVLFLAWGATLFGFASWAALLHRYPTGVDLAVRAADPGVRAGERRAVPRRIAGRDADRRRAAGVRRPGGERLRRAHEGVARPSTLISAPQDRLAKPRRSSRNDAGTVTKSAASIASGFGTPAKSTAR